MYKNTITTGRQRFGIYYPVYQSIPICILYRFATPQIKYINLIISKFAKLTNSLSITITQNFLLKVSFQRK